AVRLRVAAGDGREAAIVHTRITADTATAPAPRMTTSIVGSFASVLDLDHAAHPHRAGDEHHRADRGQHETRAPGQLVDVAGIDHRHGAGEQQRQGHEHVGGDPALGGDDLDVALDPLALADGRGDRVEDLGEIPADLAVDLDGLRHPVDVL